MRSMLVGYLPDSFGQSGGMPQILKGFGIDSAVFMRGMPTHLVPESEFIWEGVNGERVLGDLFTNGLQQCHVPPKEPDHVSNIQPERKPSGVWENGRPPGIYY